MSHADFVPMIQLTAGFWLSVDQTQQIVGTSRHIPNLLQLCESGKNIGDFTPQQQLDLFDYHSKDRFSKLLDVLVRLELLKLKVSV